MTMISRQHRKIIAVIGLCILVLFCAACTIPRDKVIASLGSCQQREFYTSGGFQDYTDYAKYHYASAGIEENRYFRRIQTADMETINSHLDDFEKWIEAIEKSDAFNEVVVHYDYDRKIIDTEDYFYIESEEHTWSDGHTSLVRYNVYLFDAQTQVLYYFHNNI